MNMLLHGVKDSEFDIYHGDTLTNDWDMLKETNPAKMPRFDAVVANPPFSYRWEPTDALMGGLGADSIVGGGGEDVLLGGNGNDSILGGSGNDIILGGAGDDSLAGSSKLAAGDSAADGADTILGGTGKDRLFGGLGNDILSGDDDNETLSGELSDTTLVVRVRKAGVKLHLNGTTGAEDEIAELLKYRPDSLSSDDPARLTATLKALGNP